MKIYGYRDEPLEIHGVPHFEERGVLERLPDDVREKIPSLAFLGRRTPGARLCFRTNSPRFTLKMEFETLSFDIGMSVFNCQAACVYVGERQRSRFAGLAFPANYEQKVVEKTFEKSAEMEDIVIWLPRNEVIADISVEVEDDSIVEAPTPYKYPPVLYYGSSITECGLASKVSNGYNSMITRRLDADCYNMGFSGSARGEPEMADYINTIPMSVFVMDYDHNAPNPQHLRETHKAFFTKIRQQNPDLPIVIMTRPDFEYDPLSAERRSIIRQTYDDAVAAGDENVYFIDGETFFGEEDRVFCTTDGCHPNDLGFYRMANIVEPVIKSILVARYGEK